MALAGPQIGGVSLLVHTIIIVVFTTKSIISKINQVITGFYQRTFRPTRPDAK